MTNKQFIHLQCHSQYSLLESTVRISHMMEYCKTYKVPSIAITDNGNMFGVINFYQMAKSCGINPIVGCELVLARNMTEKEKSYCLFGYCRRTL